VILARALVGLAAGFLLSTSAVFVAAGWRAGCGCLAVAVACGVLGLDVDRTMRRSRWKVADQQRAAQALLEAQFKALPWSQPGADPAGDIRAFWRRALDGA
jgi:protein-S-isoprenylcysteine O-methyltransferase Ste14